MIIGIIIFIILGVIIGIAGWLAWQATPGARPNKALAAGVTAAAIVLLAIVFFTQVLYFIVVSAVIIAAVGVATRRLSFWQGLAAGIGAPVVLYIGIIIIHLLHALTFGGDITASSSSFQIETVATTQVFGIDLAMLIAVLGAATLMAAIVASAEARPWLAFAGGVMLLGGGAVVLHHHWDTVTRHIDLSDPRTWMWFVVGKVAVIVLVASLFNHGRRGGGP